MTLPRYSKANHTNCFLYCNNYSYHSQKVHLALLYYKLKFKFQEINTLENEQFKPWFVRINPDASLPVLRHGTRIITNTIHILEYLESQIVKGFSLLPAETYNKINHYMILIDNISMSTLRYWILNNHELAVKTKIPSHIRAKEISNFVNIKSTLSHLAERHPDLRNQYAGLVDKYTALKTRIEDRREIDVLTATIESVLDELEHELQVTAAQCESNERLGAANKSPTTKADSMPNGYSLTKKAPAVNNWCWLFSRKNITAADIWVIVLLSQLDTLGLAPSYWGPNLRPHIARYFQQASNMEFIRTAIPQYSYYKSFLDGIGYTQRPKLFWGLGCAAFASITIGVVLFVYWRVKAGSLTKISSAQ